jgi:hypothetical protein
LSIGALADAIAAFHGVPLVELADSKTYSFRMSCSRIRSLCGAPRDQSLAACCAAFTDAYLASDVGSPMRIAS